MNKKKISNSKKDNFLNSIPTVSLDDEKDTLTKRCKFNFSYMDCDQAAGQRFEDWSKGQLTQFLNKLREYSKHPLNYWQQQSVGKRKNKILEIYKKFPQSSDFTHPKHVPHQAYWGRFRMGSKVRLVGFIVPYGYHNKEHEKTHCYFDCNTFYVVFLDANHRFYKGKS